MLRSQWDCPVAPQQQCAAACCPPPTGPSLIGVSAAGTRELGRWSGLLWAGCVEHAAAAALGVAVSVAPAAPVDFGRRPLALVVRRAAGVEQAGYAELFRSALVVRSASGLLAQGRDVGPATARLLRHVALLVIAAGTGSRDGRGSGVGRAHQLRPVRVLRTGDSIGWRAQHDRVDEKALLVRSAVRVVLHVCTSKAHGDDGGTMAYCKASTGAHPSCSASSRTRSPRR